MMTHNTSRFKLFGLLWWLVSYIHVDDVGESGPFLSLLFIGDKNMSGVLTIFHTSVTNGLEGGIFNPNFK